MASDLFFTPSGPELDCPSCTRPILLGDAPVSRCPHCGWSPDGTVARPAPALAAPESRVRNGWLCVLLGVLTLGVYFVYWRYAVFREVHQQEGSRHRTLLFWLGLLTTVLLVTTVLSRLGQLRHAMEAVAFTAQQQDAFVRHFPPVIALLAVSEVLLAAYMWRETRGLNRAAQQAASSSRAMPALFILCGALGIGNGLATAVEAQILFGVASTLAMLVAYGLTQGTLNSYWNALARSRATPRTTPPPPSAFTA